MTRGYGMKPAKSSKIIDPDLFGISFSVKQCRNFSLDSRETLDWLLAQGWRRFRLMSYWDEVEKTSDHYDFTELDRQIDQISRVGGIVTMCLGVKQPRWPEYHWPKWALGLNQLERSSALLRFIEQVVARYKDNESIISWQLENEALLRGFGQNIAIDRRRLRSEYNLIKQLDTARPIIMSTSNGWGIPLRRPRPDLIGFSYYLMMHEKGRYTPSIQKPWLHKFRKQILRLILGRSVFIHELQLEPWGPEAIWKMTTTEQNISMSTQQITKNIQLAKSIKASPIDMWGAEWWYWRHKQGDSETWKTVRSALSD